MTYEISRVISSPVYNGFGITVDSDQDLLDLINRDDVFPIPITYS